MVESFDRPLVGPAARTNSDVTLTSLAFINVTWETKRASYLDNFVPYALEALRASGGRLSQQQIQRFIVERFGLDFPVDVIQSLVNRAVKGKKIVRLFPFREVELAQGIAEKLPDLGAQQMDYTRRMNHLVQGLVTFARERFDQIWDEVAANESLLAHIESHTIPLLASSTRGAVYSAPGDPSTGRGYIVAAYVASIVDNDPVGFDYLDGMVKGSMLASALYVDATGQVTRHFKRTTLYLDTSICLRALGHEGDDARKATSQMLGLATSQGAQLACFDHNVREIRGILDGAKAALRRAPGAESAMRGVATHFRDSGGTPADIDLALVSLESDLRSLRIPIVSTPSHTRELGVDETALEDRLQRHVGYRETKTLLADLSSLTAIHRLRSGASGPHLETCRAVFITSNAGIVSASRAFFNSGKHEWPLVMLDHTMATLLWVKSPSAAPDLPRMQVIADCYAAMSPSGHLWSLISTEIDRLDQRGEISEDSIAMLRYSHEAEQALMEVTLGDPSRVSEQNLRKALDRARSAAAEPAEKDRASALERAQAAEAAEAQAQFEAEREGARSRELHDRLTAMEVRDAEREAELQRREDEVRQRVNRRTGRIALGVRLTALAVVAVSVLAGVSTLIPGIDDWLPSWSSLPLRICAVAALILGAATLVYGSSVNEWVDRLRKRAVTKALRKAGLNHE